VKEHKIAGGGGIQLHLVETGKASGRAILFIHGFSQCWRAWSRQMSSELAKDYRLVAMDMRGHGLSDKPREGYDDSKLWADDVNAAIRTLRLDQPILCGWSYGPLVILDYIRHHGEDDISGMVFIGGVTRLGKEATAVLSPEFLGLFPGFFATEPDASARSLEALLRLCFAHTPPVEDLQQMLEYNVSVPAYVRKGLFSRSFANDDLLSRIRKPVLIVHGSDDAVVKPAIVDEHKRALRHAQIEVMSNCGHAAFWDDAAGFNRRLRDFSANL